MPKSRGKATQNRHENGLAAPGKRIGKQKSNSNLRPQPNGNASPPSSPVHSSPAEPQLTSFSSPHAVDPPNGTAAAAGTMATATKPLHVNGPSASPDFPILTSSEAHAFEAGLLGDTHAHGRADDLGGKASMAGIGDSLMLATTILRSCPLRDVIAILIILLQLPPTFLTIVNALYTLLTFVPPTPGVLPTLHEMLLGATGAPSLPTVILTDGLILLGWFCLWDSAQNYLLDLAQAVIAVSLGGAAAGKNGTTNGFLVCAAIVLASHLNRHNQVRYYGHRIVWAALSRVTSGQIEAPPQPGPPQDIIWTPRSWINRGFALHIFSQGVLRWIRRALMLRKNSTAESASNSADPESGLPSQSQRSNSIGADSNPDTSSSVSSDGRPPGQPPAPGQGKEKDTHSKRKRKQANLVRRLQPFWAALASTKVTVMKEMEQAQPSQDAVEADATDINNIGNANGQETSRVWITELLPTEIRFQGAAFQSASQDSTNTLHVGEDRSAGADKTKPFYVRLNGAAWFSTRIHLKNTFLDSSGETVDSWGGEIYGLTPLSSYFCEFIRCSDGRRISAVNVTSPQAPTAEQVSAPTSTHQSFRPSSPTTTLRNSIVAVDASLTELRNKLKKVRKEHKSSITSLRKEVDSLVVRSESAGNNDDRQRQRILQMKQNIQTANNASAEMSEQVDFLATLPEEEIQDYDVTKRQWEKSHAALKRARESLGEATKKANLEQSQLKSDILSVTQKRDRLKARLDKLNEQYERLSTATVSGQTAKAQRDSLRARAVIEREIKEGQIVLQIDSLDRERDQVLQKVAAVQQKVQLFQHQHHQQSTQSASYYLPTTTATTTDLLRSSAPTTPEGVIPNTRSFVPHAPTFPTFGPPGLPYSSQSVTPSLPPATLAFTTSGVSGSTLYREPTTRGRSSSMLSDVSGLTDHQDALSVGPGGVTEEYPAGGRNGWEPMSPAAQYGQPVVGSGGAGSNAKVMGSPPGSAPRLSPSQSL
ncbi:MAG: hypothetical protein M1822_004515 [Bathelium mastoideum]|nr:MAG: hypothetical protein M1822_004515 [Bathelium mastoideum]